MHRSISDKINADRAKEGLGAMPAWQKFSVSSFTGALGALLGCPMDVALVRMQADTTAVGAAKRGYKNIGDALLQIIRHDGVTALWRGALPLVARGTGLFVHNSPCGSIDAFYVS